MRPAAVAIALTAALLLASCGGGDDPLVGGSPTPAAMRTGEPATADPTPTCAEEEHPKLQSGSHLIGDAEPPVPYSSTPPTSGWHASGLPQPGVHDEPLSEPQMVSLLEGGGVVAAYDPARLALEDVEALEALALASEEGYLSVTPYEVEMPTPLALTAWGVLQRCTVFDRTAVAAFVEAHHDQTGDEH